MRVFDIGERDDQSPASSRVLTIPNLLSFARLLALPWIALDLLAGNLLRALVVLGVFAATDWLDGYLARRLDQVSRLGALLDPISDRALFIVVGVGFVLIELLPLWALVVLVVRDGLVLLAGAALLGAGRRPPAVTRTGKAATFGLMWVFPIWLIGAIIGAGPQDPHPVLDLLGWALYAVFTFLYYLAAAQYARAILAGRDS